MSNFLERKKKKDSQANWIFILLSLVLIAGGAYLIYINSLLKFILMNSSFLAKKYL